MDYVMIGNSAAALGAIEAIRQKDKLKPITVVSDETYPCYSRPAIAHYLCGDIGLEAMYLRDEFYYTRNNIKTFFKKGVVKIDVDKKEIVLDDKNSLRWDKLLISTGGVPIFPDIKGKDKRNVFTFTKWDDAKKIAKAIEVLGTEHRAPRTEYREPSAEHRVRRAVILGGGLIGLCVTEALEHLGLEVIIIEFAQRILKPAMDEVACGMLTERLKRQGIKIITSDTIVGITGHTKVEGVLLKSGEKIMCDLVVIAIGVKPNIESVQNTPIKTNHGILIDTHCRTNVKDIFAAGDCTESFDPLYKENRVIPIWPNAYQQGKIAGANMAGADLEYTWGFAMNSFAFYDIPIISCGINDPPLNSGYEILSKLDGDKNTYRKIVLKGDRVVGAIFVGDIERSGMVTDLIRSQMDVSNFKERLLDDDLGYISFPGSYRKERLEQPV